MIKTLSSNAKGADLSPGWEAKISTCLVAKKPKCKTEAIL